MSLSSGVSYNILIWIYSKWTPSLLFSFKALRQLWGFGSRMFIAMVLDTFISRMDFLIIGKLYAPATLGFFQRAKSLNAIVVKYSSGTLIPILFPTLSKIQNDLLQFQNIIVKLYGVVNFVVFLLLGGLYLVSEELIVLLFTEKWLPSVEYLKLLILSGFEVAIGAVLITVLSGRGNSKAFLRLEIYKKILFVANLSLIYYIGINGYLYGLVLISILSFSLNVIFASREIKIPMRVFFKPFISQAIITVVIVSFLMLIFQQFTLPMLASFLFKGLLFTFLYIVMNWLLKTSSYRYFNELLLPILKQKFSK